MSQQTAIITQENSEYNQASFIGGMNLLLDDTRLQTNQYRIGFDLTNRLDTLDPVLASVEDLAIPRGVIQECVTFGQYVILFVSGKAYYRYYNDVTWTVIPGFKMDTAAPRYWTCAVPVGLTNYVRIANIATIGGQVFTTVNAGIQQLIIQGSAQGNNPGLIVQDNINQPQFIFLDAQGSPTVRVTQSFAQWAIGFTDATNTVVGPYTGGHLAASADKTYDLREYVPVGNSMCWTNGILFITASDFNSIYRSVSGRPLDFVVNVVNSLVTGTGSAFVVNGVVKYACWQFGGGDATTTSYGVGLGGISCIRALGTGGLFVSASNANFAVTLNQTQNAPTIFGEYTFNRAFLFNATCLSDRTIFDSIGDTKFIELTGVRSFNAIENLLNQGRNSVFSEDIQGAFGPDQTPLIQDASSTSAILFNNYELYSVNTIFGPVIAKYDTINNCWVSFDVQQTDGVAVKLFAKIELEVLRLYAVTSDNRLFTLYSDTTKSTTPYFRTIGVCSSIIWAGSTIKTAQPKIELKLAKTRVILNRVTEDCECVFTPYCNNRISMVGNVSKEITFEQMPTPPSYVPDPLALSDVGTQLMNILWSTPDIEQGWKYFAIFTWTDGSLTQFSMELTTQNPINPAYSQGLTS